MEADKIPAHVAIIMDGNRRWAKKRGLPANLGHKEGYTRFLEIGELCRKKGIKTLTVYALSTENLKNRDSKELDALMSLMRRGIIDKINDLDRDNIQVKVIGRLTDLPEDLQNDLADAVKKTEGNTGSHLNIAVSYGGRAEIVDAARKIIDEGIKAGELTEEIFADNLYTVGQNDPDLVIRTGGSKRLSNFLLWQSSYAEIYFTDTLWPDFDHDELDAALEYFARTKRNFGK